jgi:hypothetical protein
MAERFGGHEAPARPVELPRVPAGPAQGAVRRTARPTGDRQTPETAPQESAGTTNTASPVPGDQPAVSSRVSSRPEFGDPEGPRRDPVGTVREHDDGSRAVKVTDGLATHPWCSVTPRGTVWLADEDVAEWGTEREWRLEELRAKLHADDPDSLVIAIPDNDAENFLELPDCTACEGTGKDDHGTPFEAPLAVHFVGPYVTIGGRRRQLCAWCGHVLLDVQLAPGQEHEPWFDVKLVRVEDGTTTRQPYTYGDPLPPGCCALPDDGEPVCICTVESTPCPDCRDEDQADDDVPVDPDDGYPVDLCGKHTGTSSNRCLLRTGHTGDHSDEFETPDDEPARAYLDDAEHDDIWPRSCTFVHDGQRCTFAPGHHELWHRLPDGTEVNNEGESMADEAQETRAASDWPAETEVDRG